jgi:hypothetical protein
MTATSMTSPVTGDLVPPFRAKGFYAVLVASTALALAVTLAGISVIGMLAGRGGVRLLPCHPIRMMRVGPSTSQHGHVGWCAGGADETLPGQVIAVAAG